MQFKNPRVTALILFVSLLAMVAAAACGGGEPETLELPVKIEAGVMSPETIKVKQGDMVTLKIQADEAGEFHLHTYDVEADIEAAVETDFYFVASATGRFKITTHKDNQADLAMRIYQGDSPKVAENSLLGEFTFSGLREGPAGSVNVEVILDVNSEGILALDARDVDTGAMMQQTVRFTKA